MGIAGAVDARLPGWSSVIREDRLWARTADGTDLVAQRDAITWALARAELAGAPRSVTAAIAYLPRRVDPIKTPLESSTAGAQLLVDGEAK